MSKVLRIAGWFLLLSCLLIVVLLVILRFRPEAAVWAANTTLEETQIDTVGLELRYFPPSLNVTQAIIELPDQRIDLTQLSAELDASAWRSDRPFWSITTDTVEIDVYPTDASTTTTPTNPPPTTLVIPNLHPLLTFTKLGVNRLQMNGTTALSASLTATHEEATAETHLSATFEQADQRYHLKGRLNTTQARAVGFDLTIRSDGDDAKRTRLDAHLAGRLASGAATTLTVTEGNLIINLDGATHSLTDLAGNLQITTTGERIEFDALQARIASPAAGGQHVAVELSGNAVFEGQQLSIVTQGHVGQTEIAAQLAIANESGAVSGEFDLASQGLPSGIDHAPFSTAALFPATLSAEFSVAGETLNVQQFVLESPRNALSGDISVSTASPVKLMANLSATRLYIPLLSQVDAAGGIDPAESTTEAIPPEAGANAPADVGASGDGSPTSPEPVGEMIAATDRTALDTPDTPDTPDNAPTDADRIFSEASIDWSWLATAEVDVTLTAQELALQDAVFTELDIGLKNQAGTLSLDPLSAKLGEGGFNGSAQIALKEDASPTTRVGVNALFELSGVDLEAFGLVPTNELSGGEVEAAIDLMTIGNSSAELAAGLNGDILLMVEDATLMNDFVELAGSDLVMETLNKLNPFAKKDPTTELSCALVHFTAQDGKLTTKNQLVMETTKMEIVGNGSINLADEKISLGITPNAKSGVGINVGSAVKFLKLGGTLAAPRPAVSASGLLKSGLAIGAAISTGGASVIAEGLAKRVLNTGSACDAARKGSAPDEAADSPEPTDTETPSTTDTAG